MFTLCFRITSVFSPNSLSLHVHVTCYWVNYDWFLFQQLCTLHTCWLAIWHEIICESWLTDAIIMPQFVHIVCIWNANINSMLGTWNVGHWNCNLSKWNAYLLQYVIRLSAETMEYPTGHLYFLRIQISSTSLQAYLNFTLMLP